MGALDLDAIRQLLTAAASAGGRVALWGALGLGIGAATGAVAALATQLLVARPLLRWGFGPSGAAGCASAALLVAGGVLGGAWGGVWLGASHPVEAAVENRFILEDAALSALVAAATSGRPNADPAEALREMIEAAGGSLTAIAHDVEARTEEERTGIRLPAMLSGDGVRGLAAALEERGLVEARNLTAVHRAGGFAPAIAGADPELSAYASRVIDATASVRSQLLLAIGSLVWPNVIAGPVAGLGAPLTLVACLAAAGRLTLRSARDSSSGRP